MPIKLEVPVFGPDSAIQAVPLDVSRLELNARGSYPAGGLTPLLEDLIPLASLDVPLRIMIRPRGPPADGRDFIYTDAEFSQMDADIARLRESGLLSVDRGDGFVFGIIVEDGSDQSSVADKRLPCFVDKGRCASLVRAARPFKTVFHRAFDEIVSSGDHVANSDAPSWSRALDDVSACGFDGILTSGGLGRAVDNLDTLEKVVDKAETLGVEIIVGGGVRKSNVREIVERLDLGRKRGSILVHSACLSGTGGEVVDTGEVHGLLGSLV
ncbi:CutC [Xylariomycetidae sp. FL2044]|nr:CutC [Xylariomycetidae sp. FL2044]